MKMQKGLINGMQKLIQANSLYFVLVSLFFLVGLPILFLQEQGDGIRLFSENRTVIGDDFFSIATQLGEGKIYVLLTLFFLFIRFRFAILMPLTGLIVLLVSHFSKRIFGHPRPILYFQQSGIVDQFEYVDGIVLHAGYTSFPSGHTMSAFALFGLLAFLMREKKIAAIFMFIVALLVGISRVYLVQHFFKDILFGALVGTVLAMTIYFIQNKLPYNPHKWYDLSLLNWRWSK